MVICDGVTESGTRYEIDNSFMALRGSAEERRIIEAQRQAAFEILTAYTQRRKEMGTCPEGRLSLEALVTPS